MAQKKNSKTHNKRDGRPAPVEHKNGKRAEAGPGAADSGPRFSMFTWLVVVALLGVWSSVAVFYFDIVDYDRVLARAQEFRMNFSEVLQGKLAAYDTDGDGDFDVEDAKVLLGLTKDGGRSANAESLEEVLNILAEEGSDWIYGFFTFLYDVVSPPAQRGEEEEEEGREASADDVEVKGVILDLQNQ
uniref:Un-named hu7910 n=1 Tax=Poecilia reticulata TaxID=8081 RepID=A0A3P9NYQ8_POERE